MKENFCVNINNDILTLEYVNWSAIKIISSFTSAPSDSRIQISSILILDSAASPSTFLTALFLFFFHLNYKLSLFCLFVDTKYLSLEYIGASDWWNLTDVIIQCITISNVCFFFCFNYTHSIYAQLHLQRRSLLLLIAKNP